MRGAGVTAEHARLLSSIKEALPKLRELLARADGHWASEDGFYRFYHQSFKVYGLQRETVAIVEALQGLMPDRPLNDWFRKIIGEGTGKKFADDHNQRWLEETRPILEAFYHARTMLEFAVRYGEELDEVPKLLPSGWAAVLYLYDLR